jgi:nicotinamide-nucleotide amidase
VVPAIAAMTGKLRVIRHKQIKCFGVGESDLEQMLPDMIRRGRDPLVGITVHGATITLRITASGESAEACYESMAPTIASIRESLGDLVFGEGEDELEHAVVRLLAAQDNTLATAEWGSGGMIAHWLSEIPESGGRVVGGLVARDYAALPALLGISSADPTSAQQQVVALMAEAVRTKLGADYGLAVGELPAVDPNAAEPLLLWFAVAGPNGATVKSSPYAGHPDILKMRGGKQALNLLRLALLRAGRQADESPVVGDGAKQDEMRGR